MKQYYSLRHLSVLLQKANHPALAKMVGMKYRK